jgi:hypothetical protein
MKLNVELAPAGVIRAAAWPIESLDSFGDSQLAALALRAASVRQRMWSHYVQAYEQSLECERETLWRITAEDSWFMKALLLSNPPVADRVRRSEPRRRGPRTKSIRLVENTLYRYLARGAGRTTPHGLWAGVGEVGFAHTVQHQPAVPQYFFSPDLRPFQTILRSLARRSIYRNRAHWRANPTLARQADGSWRYWARTGDGKVVRREVAQSQGLDPLFDGVVRLESGTFEEFVAVAAAAPSGGANVAQELGPYPDLRSALDGLADAGVLLGGLDLPNRFTNAWQALSAVEDRLVFPDRHAWNGAVRELHCLCDGLSADLKAMTLEALEGRLRQAAGCVDKLAKDLNVPLPVLPNPMLRCDLGLPFQVEFDGAQHAALLQALQEYECGWINGLSPAAAFRNALREQLEREIGCGLGLGGLKPNSGLNSSALTPVWAELGAPPCSEVEARLAEWERRLLQNKPEVVLELSARPPASMAEAPLGCLYAGLFDGFQIVVHGVGDDPGRAFARHFEQLGLRRLHLWLRQCLAGLGARHGIEVAELHGPFEENPNVLARPEFGTLQFELWGASPDAMSLFGAKVVVEPSTRLPFLRLPSIQRPIAVFWFSSANVVTSDPISAQLLRTSFQESFAAGFRASALPVDAEVNSPRFSPRIRLPGGAIMRPRRTVLSGRALEDLAQASAAERYAQWQQLAAKHQWPALLNLQREGEPPLLMRRDSPLALESILRGVRDHMKSLIVEELVGAPWLVGADGRRHLVEIALPFFRTAHGWSSRVNGGSAVEQNRPSTADSH